MTMIIFHNKLSGTYRILYILWHSMLQNMIIVIIDFDSIIMSHETPFLYEGEFHCKLLNVLKYTYKN